MSYPGKQKTQDAKKGYSLIQMEWPPELVVPLECRKALWSYMYSLRYLHGLIKAWRETGTLNEDELSFMMNEIDTWHQGMGYAEDTDE